jgi:RHS repeat-associated protein
MPGRQFNSNSYRYGYQNQEIDQELWGGAVSFKYRVEDPRLGRFFSVDPLSDKFAWNSPYAFSENRVIDGIELEGLEVVVLNKNKDAIIIEAANRNKDANSNDGFISVWAHGENRGIKMSAPGVKTSLKGWVTSAKEFDAVMTKLSPEYAQAKKDGKKMVIELHSCRSGKDYVDNKKGIETDAIAKQISTLPNTTVIGADSKIAVAKDKNGGYEMGPMLPAYGAADQNGDWKKDDNQKYSGERGKWLIFKEGKEVGKKETLNEAKTTATE